MIRLRQVTAFASGLWAALVAWVLWAGSLDLIAPGGTADSPPFQYTSTSGKGFFINFHAKRFK